MNSPDSDLPQSLWDSLFRAFLPLARTLLEAGVSYREFEVLSREAFVLAASTLDGVRGRETNTSRIAHMTGLTRKEVKRIRNKLAEMGGKHLDWQEVQRPGDILHGWYSDPEFLAAEGGPKRLSIADEFERLVKRYGGDIPPGAIRKELKRVNAILEHEDGTVEPLKPYYVPIDAIDRLRTSLSFSLFGLLSTIRHNSDPKRTTAGRLERFVSNDRIPLKNIEKIRETLRSEAEGFSLQMDDLLSQYEVAENSSVADTYLNVGLGIFYYEEDISD